MTSPTQSTNSAQHPLQNTYVPQYTPQATLPPTAQMAQPPALHVIPPKVAAAISQVMGLMPRLERTEKNVHGNYAFASIDDFLEAVRPACADAGLIIVQDEVSTDMITAGVDRNGKPRNWLRIVHGFTLAHSSGETWQHRPQRTAMVDATMGSQGYGAAQSYTLKLFLRSLFQIATGEGQDVDHQPPNPLPGKDDERAAFLVSTLKIIATHKDVAALSSWWNSNEEKALRRAHDLSPEEVEGLKAALLKHRQDLDNLRRNPEPEVPPPAPEVEEDYEHPGDLTQRIVDNLDAMNVDLEIVEYMANNNVWKKIDTLVFSKPQADVIEKAFKQAIERATAPVGDMPPDPSM